MTATPISDVPRYSYDLYEGVVAGQNFAITFPYLTKDSVRVWFTPEGADRADAEIEIPPEEFTWNTDSEIRTDVPLTGTVRIERETFEDSQLVLWQDGSTIVADDLNLSDTQWLYLLQEHHDWMVDRRGSTLIGPLILARDAVNPLEPVTKQVFDQEVAKYLPLAGGQMTGPLLLARNPLLDQEAATRGYVRDLIQGIAGPEGTLTLLRNPLRLYVSQSINAADSNNGTSIGEPLASFDEAIARAQPGTIITVEPGVYQIANLPFRVPRDVSIIGDSLRNVVLTPAPGSEFNSFFKVDSGFYCWGITFAGHQADDTRQAWVVEFDELADNTALGATGPGAYILKSPYIQNCSSYTAEDDAGTAGSKSTGNTGGGMLVDGDACAPNSPIRSMVVDSFTQINLDGPGCLVRNNAYVQLVSFFATFCSYHVRCESGSVANISGGSTTDFGRTGLVADGFSPAPIYTASARVQADVNAAEMDVISLSPYHYRVGTRSAFAAVPVAGQLFFPRLVFPSNSPEDFTYTRIDDRNFRYTAPTAPAGPDHEYAGGGSATIGGVVYNIENCTYDKDTGEVVVTTTTDIPAAANGTVTMDGLEFICLQSGYVVQGSVPIDGAGNVVTEDDPLKAGYRIQFFSPTRAGLQHAVTAGQTIDFRLRSLITAPNHTFEYVGSGTNYDALPFSGGRPDPSKQIVETRLGRVFFSGTDELGNLSVGKQFFVDGTSGEVTINTDSFNISGLNAIGPFSRNGGISTVGVQIKEASNNTTLLNSLGLRGGDTVPTQNAVGGYVDGEINTVTSLITSEIARVEGLAIQGPSVSAGKVSTIVPISQTDYDALGTKDSQTLYIILG